MALNIQVPQMTAATSCYIIERKFKFTDSAVRDRRALSAAGVVCSLGALVCGFDWAGNRAKLRRSDSSWADTG